MLDNVMLLRYCWDMVEILLGDTVEILLGDTVEILLGDTVRIRGKR